MGGRSRVDPRLVEEIAAPYRAQVAVDYRRGVPPAVNDPEAAGAFRAAAGTLLGPAGVHETPQSMGADDFGWFLDRVPGVMARLGVRRPGTLDAPDLHCGDFDVDEAAIGCGTRVLVVTAMSALRHRGCDQLCELEVLLHGEGVGHTRGVVSARQGGHIRVVTSHRDHEVVGVDPAVVSGIPTLGHPAVPLVWVRIQDLDPRVTPTFPAEMPRHIPGRYSCCSARRQHDVGVILADPAAAGQRLGCAGADPRYPPLVVEATVDSLTQQRNVRITARRHQLDDRALGAGQSGGPEVAAVDHGVVWPSGLVGTGHDVEYKLDAIIDPGHADVDRLVAEAIKEGPRARRRHSVHGKLPTAPLLRSVGRGGTTLSRWRRSVTGAL